MMCKTLYICYFGLREPLVQTQVLPYLREIGKAGIEVNLLTFEPKFRKNWDVKQIDIEKKKLAVEGINWYCLPYHKRPSAIVTSYDVLRGAALVLKIVRRKKINVLHARTHVPLMMALLIKPFTNCKLIFDIRGLIAEEYADAGIWRENSKIYRFIKNIERKGIKQASQIVVLTNRFRDYLVENKLKDRESIEVIPCCVDFSRIEQGFDKSEKSNRFELIYAGSATGLYLLREMGLFFLELKKYKPDAFFRVLTTSPKELVQEVLGQLKISENDYAVAKVSPEKVPLYLKKAHLGISFRKATFAQIAASPTKIPEYLACGLPVISNYGIGDTDWLLENEEVGIYLKNFDQKEIEKAVKKIIKLEESEIAEKCAKVAVKYFDLETVGGKRYENVYRRLSE